MIELVRGRHNLRFALLAALAGGCSATPGAAPDETRLVAAMLTDGTAEADADCAARELDRCIGEGGTCRAETEALVACVDAASCILPEGVIDEECALERCPGEVDALNGCAVDECASYFACFDAPPPPPPATDLACREAFDACALGACRAAYRTFYTCSEAAGCIDEDGFYDYACGDERCGDEVIELSSCFEESCPETVDACGAPDVDEPSREPAPVVDCEPELAACVYDEDAICAASYRAFLQCAVDAECVDEIGVYDSECGLSRCGAEIDVLRACLPACELSPTCG